MLAEHPLKTWIDEVIKLDWEHASTTSSGPGTPVRAESTVGKASEPKAWLCQKLGLDAGNRLTEASIRTAIEDWSEIKCLELASEMEGIYPKATERTVLQKAIDKKFSELV